MHLVALLLSTSLLCTSIFMLHQGNENEEVGGGAMALELPFYLRPVEQHVRVKGILFCVIYQGSRSLQQMLHQDAFPGPSPILWRHRGAVVELWEHDSFSGDDLLASTRTASDGVFYLRGTQAEHVRLSPYLRIIHRCLPGGRGFASAESNYTAITTIPLSEVSSSSAMDDDDNNEGKNNEDDGGVFFFEGGTPATTAVDGMMVVVLGQGPWPEVKPRK